jgi:Zn-dependent M28 family amino/carboxypeptidase
MRKHVLFVVVTLLFSVSAIAQQRFDAADLLTDQRFLASDELEGRRTGSEGNRQARQFILERFETVGLEPTGRSFLQSFRFTNPRDSLSYEGVNVIGMVRGSECPERYIVVSAHYDHLGVRNGQIYNGADDNASGTAALLALARYFVENPPSHSILFVAFDAEEMGLQGARHFIADPPVNLQNIDLNVNMDMISRNPADEIYAAGTYHYPFLREHLERAAEGSHLTLLFGHDRPDLPPGDDWTMSSDHGPFHEAGIPFIYFGVEDHPGYHHPSDTFENITPGFYIRAVDLILDAILELEANLATISAATGVGHGY